MNVFSEYPEKNPKNPNLPEYIIYIGIIGCIVIDRNVPNIKYGILFICVIFVSFKYPLPIKFYKSWKKKVYSNISNDDIDIILELVIEVKKVNNIVEKVNFF